MSATIPFTRGRYRLLDKLDEGSTGDVYRAFDRLTGQTVAIKQVTPQLKPSTSFEETMDLRLSLAHEFETLASLRHPNIIDVLDYGFDLTEDKRPYIVMTLIENPQTILQAAQGKPLETKVDLLMQMLQALAYIHRRGILHRDLKPGNVLVTNGQVKLLDFGLALTREESRHAEVGGTLAYIAPEVLTGAQPSVASDLYSVGVMAYEMFSGQHPFSLEDTTEFINSLLLTPANTKLLEVSDELSALVDKLLAKTPDARPLDAFTVIEQFCRAAQRPVPRESTAIRESFLQAAKFVGRDKELAELTEALKAIMGGDAGGIWLVGGESGVGKSRLLDELRTRALVRGAFVVRGQADSGDGTLFRLGRDVLRRVVISTEVSDENASILKQFVPDVDTLLGREVADAPPMERDAAQQRLLTAIANTFYGLDQPTVVVLEDLHWANGVVEVLNTLRFVTRERPLLVIGSYRDDEVANLPEKVSGAQLLKLERLSAQSIAELSKSMLGETVGSQQPVIDLLQRETEGNAFFLVEVVRALAEDAGRLDFIGTRTLPETVFAGGMRSVVERRLARVPLVGRPLLERAAVMGRYLDLDALRILAKNKSIAAYKELDLWLGECATAAVFDVSECCWRFSHDKLREGVLENLKTGTLAKLHREVAEALEAAHPPSGENAAVLADHWRVAGEPEKEGYYAAVAGDRALNLSAFGNAIDYFTRALSCLDNILTPYERSGLLCRLAESYYGLSDYTHAIPLYRQSIELARESKNEDIIRDALAGLSSITLNQGRYTEATQQLEECLALFRASGDKRGEGRILNRLGIANEYQGQIERGIEYYEQALTLYRSIGDRRGEGLLLSNLSDTYVTLGQIEQARDYAQQALAIHKMINYRRNQIYDLLHLADVHANLGQLDKAVEYFKQAQDVNREVNERLVACLILNNMSIAYANLGRLEDAMDCAGRSLLLALEIGTQFGECYALRVLGEAKIAAEDIDGALQSLTDAVKIADEIHQAFVSHFTRIDLVRVYLHKGLLERALETILAARQMQLPMTHALAAVLHGIILCRMDRRDEARTIFYEGLAAAERMLSKTPDLYEQRYMRGLAQIGLAITTKEPVDRTLHLSQALETYQGAVKNCASIGVLEKMTDLLEEFAPLDTEGLLSKVRGLLVWA
jgi:tetratricopeptide (TPR) repeat protein/tRNA A-37 threonylcarbamoyl transferase component Bud32